jgi:hypothetical protein
MATYSDHDQRRLDQQSGAAMDRAQRLSTARLIACAPELLAALKDLYRSYVNTLEAGRDRILFLGGDCDPVDVMEQGNPALRRARAAIAKATGEAG